MATVQQTIKELQKIARTFNRSADEQVGHILMSKEEPHMFVQCVYVPDVAVTPLGPSQMHGNFRARILGYDTEGIFMAQDFIELDPSEIVKYKEQIEWQKERWYQEK